MSLEQRNDDLLFNITQQTGQGVHGLLDSVFGFLNRRTDFFYEMEPGDKMGFPPQVAESMVYQYFKKYQDQHYKKFPHKPELADRWKAYQEKQEQEKALAKEKAAQAQQNKDEAVEEVKQEDPKPSAAEPSNSKQEKKEEIKQEPVKQPPKEVDPKIQEISTYNGDKTEKYNWSQSVTDVVVQIPIPKGTKPKMLNVIIKPKYLSVALKGQEPIVQGDLCEKVKVDDSYWSIEDDQFLNINFEKAYEAIWKCVVLGDREIDTKTVDNSKRIDEFDLETQGHLQKVLYEQERKKMGLLTTEEEEQRKLMEKVMGADNSPFKGLPYDPKKYGQNPGNNGPAPPFAH